MKTSKSEKMNLILKTLKMSQNLREILIVDLILIQILMMIQNLVVILLLEGKTLKTWGMENKFPEVTLKVIILKEVVLDKVQKPVLFRILEKLQNKTRGHKESDEYQVSLQILACCMILK